MSQSASATASRSGTGFVLIVALIVIGLILLWHFGVLKPKPTLVLVTSGDTPYWNSVVEGAQNAADAYDVKLTVIRPKTVLAEQNDQLQQLLSHGEDGIAVSPIDAVNQANLLSQIADHAPLITFDSDSPVSQRLCFVGTDQYEAGRICGSMVRQALPDGGTVAICVGNSEKENTRLRRQGVIDEVLDRPYDKVQTIDAADQTLKANKYTILPTVVDGGDHDVAVTLAVKTIQQNPNLNCIVGLLGYSAPAIIKALDQTGNTGKIKLIGFDTNEATIAGIKSGAVVGTIMQDQYGLGFQTVRLLAENARGNHAGFPLFQRQTLPVEKITMANIGRATGEMTMATGMAATTMPSSAPTTMAATP